MSTLSITLPSNTSITNGKHITFKSPCSNKGITGLLINDDVQEYKLVDSHKQALPQSVVIFETGAMVHVILDVDEHYAYVQGASDASESQGASGVSYFNGRRGVVEPMEGDYTAAMVGASPTVHASQHASDGTDPITPASIGAASAEHSHDDVYAAIEHDHDGIYAPYNHTHDANGGIGFSQDDADKLYAAIGHTHTAEELGVATAGHTHTLEALGAAAVDHTHNFEDLNISFEDHTHTPEEIGAAPIDHTHTAAEVGAAAVDHVHSLYELGAASASHTHSASEIGAAAIKHTHTAEEVGAASIDHTHTATEIGAAPAEHTHLPSDIGALTQTEANDLYRLQNDNVEMNYQFSVQNATEITFGSKDGTDSGYTTMSLKAVLDADTNAVCAKFTDEYNGAQTVGLQNISDPINSTDAATKAYVDNMIASIVPTYVSKSGDVSITIADNTEYTLTSVTSLSIQGNTKSSHGIIYFGSSVSTPSVTGFLGTSGDDITKASAGETWEFDTYEGLVIFKNWSA